MGRCRIEVSPSLYLLGAAGLLLVPFRWLMASLLAAAFHEMCHILAVKLCGGKIRSLTLHPGGAQIQASPMERGRRIFCLLAGPLGALLILPFFCKIPYTAFCALVQSAYNLLPFENLDGGQALMALFGQTAQQRMEKCVLVLIFLLAGYLSVRLDWGIFPFAALLILARKGIYRKIPCKTAIKRLQCQ